MSGYACASCDEQHCDEQHEEVTRASGCTCAHDLVLHGTERVTVKHDDDCPMIDSGIAVDHRSAQQVRRMSGTLTRCAHLSGLQVGHALMVRPTRLLCVGCAQTAARKHISGTGRAGDECGQTVTAFYGSHPSRGGAPRSLVR